MAEHDDLEADRLLDPFTYDLCDVWLDVGDHQCESFWRVEVVLDHDVRVEQKRGGSMWGTYKAGTWRFCRMHARIFERDRTDR